MNSGVRPLVTGQIILWVLLYVGSWTWTRMGQERHLSHKFKAVPSLRIMPECRDSWNSESEHLPKTFWKVPCCFRRGSPLLDSQTDR